MALPLLFDKTTVLVKTETTELTDAVPAVGTDDILVESGSITPKWQIIERPATKDYLGNIPSIVGAYHAEWSLTFELKGAGLVGGAGTDVVVPEWDPVFRGCGLSRLTIGAAPITAYKYAPHTLNRAAIALEVLQMSFTMWVYKDGTILKLTGCHGNLSIAMTFDGKAMVTASGVGMLTDDQGSESFVTMADLAYPITQDHDGTLPAPSLNLGLTVDAFAVKAAALSFDLGNEVALRENIGRLSGYLGSYIPRRNVTATIDPELEKVATEDYFAAITAARQMVLDATLNSGGGTGEKIDFDAPVCQYVGYEPGERGGKEIITLGMALRQSSGDDELEIKVY